MSAVKRIRLFGDAGVIAETRTQAEAQAVAELAAMASWAGVEDVVVGERSVTVLWQATKADRERVRSELEALDLDTGSVREPRRFEITTKFDGPDLDEVAALAGRSASQVVKDLTDCDLEVAFLGFSPGFAYLVGLPGPLARLPRRDTPRPSVPAGSLALAGGFAAIYPQSSPGGWNLVGRTDARLFDSRTAPFALLKPGDVVRLVEGEVQVPVTESKTTLKGSGSRLVEVEQPGMFSLVEDAGRIGMASIGVPRSGAADSTAMRLANRLVGNDDDCAVIEVTASGPAMRVNTQAHVSVVGDVEIVVEGRPAPANAVVPINSGQVLAIGHVRNGLRCCVAFDGGIDTPVELGSRSSDTLCGLGPGPIRRGDVMALGPTTRPRGRLLKPPSSLEKTTLRAIAGPDEFDMEQLYLFTGETWQVAADSDRVGVRLVGPRLVPPYPGISSRATVTGAVQVPPDGAPIALMCDHATVGGYPVVATLIRADLGRLGQLGPGDAVRFELVDAAASVEAISALERELKGQVASWFPMITE